MNNKVEAFAKLDILKTLGIDYTKRKKCQGQTSPAETWRRMCSGKSNGRFMAAKFKPVRTKK